jgi:uncharacterized membrane protein YhaH (DUF805 family)
MSSISRLFEIATAGSAMSGAWFLQRSLSQVAVVIMLAVVSGFLLSTIAIGVLFAIYAGLTYYGLEPHAATLTVGLLLLALAAATITLTIRRVRHLRAASRRAFSLDLPFLSDIPQLATAFLDGFLAGRKD